MVNRARGGNPWVAGFRRPQRPFWAVLTGVKPCFDWCQIQRDITSCRPHERMICHRALALQCVRRYRESETIDDRHGGASARPSSTGAKTVQVLRPLRRPSLARTDFPPHPMWRIALLGLRTAENSGRSGGRRGALTPTGRHRPIDASPPGFGIVLRRPVLW